MSFFCDFESLREEDFGAPVKKSSVSPPPAFIPRLVLLVRLGVIFVFLSFSYRLRLIPRVLDSQQESREPPEKASKQAKNNSGDEKENQNTTTRRLL